MGIIFLQVKSLSIKKLTFARQDGLEASAMMSNPILLFLLVTATWFLLMLAAVPGYLPPIFFSEADLADEDRSIRFFLLNDARQFTAMLISGVVGIFLGWRVFRLRSWEEWAPGVIPWICFPLSMSMKAPVAYVMWLANGRRLPWATADAFVHDPFRFYIPLAAVALLFIVIVVIRLRKRAAA